ncbi:MAG: tetratricopeptide repeat protein, partial [Elusimicrobiota bacterium]|nr:tetratricopeptide repeat protein [Elusimicrobiota bacterium]
AGAFWFSGESKKKYEADIKEIKNDYDKPDCFNVIKKINKFLENKPPSHFKEEAYLYLGSCYEKRNEIDRALDIYGLANTLYPDSKFFRESLANIYLNAGFFEKSLALFSELAEKTDSSDKIYAGLAKSYASLGFYEKAEDNYAKALEMNGHEDLDLIKEYSRQLILARHYEKILAIFEKTSDEFKKDEEAQLILSRVWMHKGEYKKSLVYINAAQKIAPNRRDMALYAVFLNIMITDYDTALSKINCLTKNNKKDSLALLARAIVSLKKGNKKKSSEILRGILKNKTSFVSQIAAAMLKARRSQK